MFSDLWLHVNIPMTFSLLAPPPTPQLREPWTP